MAQINEVGAAFEQVYKNELWGKGSGPGSLPANTSAYRHFLEDFIRDNGVASVTDLGCGDWQSSKYICWEGLKYLGIDVVPEVVANNTRLYGSEMIRFIVSSEVDELPGGDLLICKEVLQHLPNDLVIKYLSKIKEKYRFALITNSVSPIEGVNEDIGPGQYRPLRLDLPPFSVAGANVLPYFPVKPSASQIWKNYVFLMIR